jgi:hypothetical protein
VRVSVGKLSGIWPMYLIVPEFGGLNYVYHCVQ